MSPEHSSWITHLLDLDKVRSSFSRLTTRYFVFFLSQMSTLLESETLIHCDKWIEIALRVKHEISSHGGMFPPLNPGALWPGASLRETQPASLVSAWYAAVRLACFLNTLINKRDILFCLDTALWRSALSFRHIFQTPVTNIFNRKWCAFFSHRMHSENSHNEALTSTFFIANLVKKEDICQCT